MTTSLSTRPTARTHQHRAFRFFVSALLLLVLSLLTTAAPAAPAAPAIVTISPTMIFTSSNVLTMEIGGRTPGPGAPVEDNGHDQLRFTSSATPQVTWAGSLVLELINGFTPVAGDTFHILDFDAARDAGAFSSITVLDHGLLAPGLSFDFSRLYTHGDVRVLGSGMTYAQWAGSVLGVPGAPATGNHDSDCYDNQQEFALALHPAFPGAHEPQGGFFSYPEGERLRLRFWRHIDRAGLTIRVQVSTDLATWTDLAVSTDSAPFIGPGFVSEDRAHPLADPGLVEVRDTVNASSAQRRHLRILVTQP